MSDHHIPKPKPPEVMAILETFQVIIDQGRVINVNGFEYCNVDNQTGRVVVNVWSKAHKRTFPIYRYHIVWWKATGKWPTNTIDHKDDIAHHDWFDNLEMMPQGSNVRKASERRSRVRH